MTIALGIMLGVNALDKAACAANQVQPHQFAPIVRVLALFKGRQSLRIDLERCKPSRSTFLHQPLRCDAEIQVRRNEKAQL